MAQSTEGDSSSQSRGRPLDYLLLVLSLYFFVSSIVLIKESAVALGKTGLNYVAGLIRNTISGVFAGWFGTALVHSSGAFDSIVVAFVSAGILPLTTAVGIILGAEVGTTVTSLQVSVLGYLTRETKMFKSTLTVALIHLLYNFGTLIICLSLELSLGAFSQLAILGSGLFSRVPGIELFPSVFELISPWVKTLLRYIPAWIGLLGGGALLIFSLSRSEKYMTRVFSTGINRRLLYSAFGSVPKALLAGFLFTVMVPSTTVMVSLLIPLAATGIIDVSYNILPYILGANIGTVFDVMVAALATGDPASIGVWLVHLFNNILGALVFLPLMRPFSTLVAKTVDFLTVSRRRTVIFVVLFHVIPLAVFIATLLQ